MRAQCEQDDATRRFAVAPARDDECLVKVIPSSGVDRPGFSARCSARSAAVTSCSIRIPTAKATTATSEPPRLEQHLAENETAIGSSSTVAAVAASGRIQ